MKTLQEEFMEEYNSNPGIVWSVSRKYFDNFHDIEDAVQSSLERAWKSYPQFRRECKFSTWLYCISLRTAVDILRKSKNHKSISYVNDFFEFHDIQDKGYDDERDLLYLDLMDHVKSLSPEDRETLNLHIKYKSYEEISAKTGVNENAVRVRFFRMKNRLRTLFLKK